MLLSLFGEAILYHTYFIIMSTQKILVNEARRNLKPARIEAQYTQNELGKRLGRSRIWVTLVENEERNFYLHDLTEWAKATGKPLFWFFQPRGEEVNVLDNLRSIKNLLGEIEKFCFETVNR